MEHLTATLKDPAFLLPLAASLGLFLSCGDGGGTGLSDHPDSTAHSASVNVAATFDCTNNNIQFRQHYYDSSEIASYRQAFLEHFHADLGEGLQEIRDSILRIPWESIEKAQDETAKEAGEPVRGIYINYGLDQDRFHPIFEFLYLNSSGNHSVYKDAAFSFDGKELVKEDSAKKFTDAYLKNIRVNRTGAGADTLRSSGNAPDPLATSFIYADNVNHLLEKNPVDSTVLVVSCISQMLCYKSLALKADEVPEFRHLVALHVADGAVDKLSPKPYDPLNPFPDHAIDMGNLCPPNCTPK